VLETGSAMFWRSLDANFQRGIRQSNDLLALSLNHFSPTGSGLPLEHLGGSTAIWRFILTLPASKKGLRQAMPTVSPANETAQHRLGLNRATLESGLLTSQHVSIYKICSYKLMGSRRRYKTQGEDALQDSLTAIT